MNASCYVLSVRFSTEHIITFLVYALEWGINAFQKGSSYSHIYLLGLVTFFFFLPCFASNCLSWTNEQVCAAFSFLPMHDPAWTGHISKNYKRERVRESWLDSSKNWPERRKKVVITPGAEWEIIHRSASNIRTQVDQHSQGFCNQSWCLRSISRMTYHWRWPS